MLRHPSRVAGPYRVNFSPEAWKKVGLMPSSTFQSLQEALERIAREMGSARPEGEDSSSALHAEVEGLVVIYQRDDASMTLTLVDILRAAPVPPGS
jgi:hypothetical protein